MTSFPSVKVPWYTDPKIERDRSHVIRDDDRISLLLDGNNSKFVLFVGKNCFHKSSSTSKNNVAHPVYLSSSEINNFLEKSSKPDLAKLASEDGTGSNNHEALVIWIGKLDKKDYWAVYCPDGENVIPNVEGGILKPLREFGDRLESETDAAILATANGLIQFHNSHKFCSNCGSKTAPAKAGGCRRCLDGCKQSVYPRLDVATIMLITSQCGRYALLGRKANWPRGRYSTLAGFAEVGETLEECCIRETFEESGVKVDRDSVQFIASQPWPFPRSLMVGFHANAPSPKGDNKNNESELPEICIDKDEMDDIRWFSKDYVAKRLEGGSTARDFIPTEEEAEFHIPGKASLARLLITRWVESDNV